MAAYRSVVVIGGGAAGAAITRALAARGVGVTLLEKAGQLCSGATWHAAGLVTRFGGSPKLKKLHVRSLALLTEMHDAHDVGLHLTGSIRVIEKGHADRLLEAKHHVEMAALYDDPALPTRLIGADEVAALHPLVDISNVEAGVYTPEDGDIDPTLLTTCIARLAKSDGATIRYNAEVDTVARRDDGRFEVTLAAGAGGECLVADAVVNAAGLWSTRFSRQLGMHHPAFVIEHQYAITESIDAIAALPHGERVPVLRDLRGSSYLRQERQGLLIGPYEDAPVVKSAWREQDGPPDGWAWDLFQPDLDRLESCLLAGMELVPALGDVGFASVINGPTIWTGDSLPRCGRTDIPGRVFRERGAPRDRLRIRARERERRSRPRPAPGTTTSTRSRTASRTACRSRST